MSAPKLPLLVRKNIKDDFDGKKEELAKKYKDVLGEDYTMEADFPTLYSQADEGYQQEKIGRAVSEAMDDFSRVLKSGTSKPEDKMLIDGFNEAVSKRIITVVMDPEFKGTWCGCRVNDGVFQLVFKPKGLGTNSYSAGEYWKKAINEGLANSNPRGLPPTAKAGIQKDFDGKKADLEEKLSKQLGGEKLTIHADFEDIWGKLVDGHKGLSEDKKKDLDLDNLARQLGNFVFSYFESLLDKVKREIKGDELMIEGFFEEVSTKQAWFGLVAESETIKGPYTDTLIEDGKLWSKSKPTKYARNVDTGFEGLSKLL